MKETSKSNKIRDNRFFQQYINGKIIDIGGGNDPVTKDAEIFDLANGDANHILKFRNKNSFDTLYSSHCLEHMNNPAQALTEWWELLKPGGHMILVVPHEDLYEQGIWPSMSPGHVSTFRTSSEQSWSPASYNIIDLIQGLPKIEILSTEIQDHGLDYDLLFPKDIKLRQRKGFIYRNLNSLAKRFRIVAPFLSKIIMKYMVDKGWFIDQTAYGALAQIQVVAYKQP